MVVLDVVHQRRGGRFRVRGQEHRRARCLRQAVALGQHLDQLLQRHRARPRLALHIGRAPHPGPDKDGKGRRHQQRHPAAVHDLGQVRQQEDGLDRQQRDHDKRDPARLPAPDIAEHDAAQERRDDHVARHCDAIGTGEVGGTSEGQHQRHDADAEDPVHLRHEDLPELGFRGVLNFQPRQQAHLNRLPRHRIGARDHRLARDHGRRRRKDDERQQEPVRGEQEERVLDRRAVRKHQRALARDS